MCSLRHVVRFGIVEYRGTAFGFSEYRDSTATNRGRQMVLANMEI